MRPAAEMTDNASKQLLKGADERKSWLHVVLKESVIISEPINAQHWLTLLDW